MDLKEFIEETISGIVDATASLQTKYQLKGAVINPPVSMHGSELYRHESEQHVFRRIEAVEFDVAVTASSETGSGAKAKLQVFSIETGLGGTHTRQNEQISRVRFVIPVVLPPTDVEGANIQAERDGRRQQTQSMRISAKDAVV